MEYLYSGMIGYLLGSISSSLLVSKYKHTDLSETGTNNLGATNVYINFGFFFGLFVMIFDIVKAMIAVNICRIMFPETPLAWLFSGCIAVIGHIFPFYNHFKGGKGVACFGGLVLAVDPREFAFLVVIGLTLSLIINYGCALPMSASIMFPFLEMARLHNILAFFIACICSVPVFCKHIENLKRIQSGEEIQFRTHLYKKLIKR